MTGNQRSALLAASAFGAIASALGSAPAHAQQVIVVPSGTMDTAQKTVGGTDSVTVEPNATLQTTSNPAINWSTASTGLLITNSGIIRTTATGGRAIGTSGTATQRSIVLTNNAGGLIESADDAVRINVNVTAGTIVVNNAGTIRTTVGGQAIDFDAIAAGTASVTINNLAGGMILSTGQDAIRPGQGAIVNNAGTIRSDGAANNSFDGIDMQGRSATVNNLTGGVISGLRHGITTDVDLNIVNNGTITGRNGSGIGSDGTGTVVNRGTISGNYDGVAINGDGDGVDIDFIGTVRNFGLIEGTGAAGVDSGGRPNSGQGVAMGGGLIENNSGATISGAAQGVLINHDTNIGGVADGATTIVNAGTIRGLGGAAIQFVGTFDDVITNSGIISGVGGTAIDMGGGNDTLNLLNGSMITGAVDGGAGTDRVTLGGTGGVFAGAVNFERLDVLAGSWTLSTIASYANGTGIASGATLTGDSATLTGGIANAGTLVINQANAGTLSAVITGSGTLVKAGAGTLAINALPGFTGPTRIDGGRLNVFGALASSVTVASGASLGGTGSVGATTVQSGGLIAPGPGLGTLGITGNFVQATGSTYAADTLASGAADRIAVTGTATIQNGATLALTRDTGTYAIGTRFTLLTATGGITGSYGTVTQTAAGGVELRQSVSGTSLTVQAVRTGAALIGLGATPNQSATANGLAPLGAANTAYAALTLIADDAATRAGLDSLSGEIHASVQTALARDALLVQRTIHTRLESQPAGMAIWGQFVGGEGEDEGSNGTATADRETTGGFGGIELPLGDTASAGLGGGYTRTRIEIEDRASTARAKSFHAFAYVGGDIAALRLRAGLGYSWSDIDTRRSIAFAGFTDATRASYDGSTFQGFIEASYVIPAGGATIEPFGRIAAARTRTNGFAETGGAAALTGGQERDNILVSSLGLRGETPLGEMFSLRGSLAWEHGFNDLIPTSTLRFAGGPAFALTGTGTSRNAAVPTIDLAWKPSATVRVTAGYAGLFGDNGDDHSGRLTVSVGF